MLSFLTDLTIVKKIRIIIAFVSFLIVFNIVGMYEISQTGHFQFLEREHIELTVLLDRKFSEFKNAQSKQQRQQALYRQATVRSELGIKPLLSEIILQPQRCLDDVTELEVLAFRLLGFGRAFDICRRDIQDNNQALALIEQYSRQGLDTAQFTAQLRTRIDNIYKNSHDFASIIPQARVFVRNLLLICNLLFSALAIFVIVVISRSVTAPLLLLRHFIEQVKSDKDLSKQHRISTQDETADIAAVFNYMLKEFEEILSSAHAHNKMLVDAANDLKIQSDQNSKHLSEQNRSTEITATAIHEITSTITDVSRNTQHAAQTANTTQQGVSSASNSIRCAAHAIEELVDGMGKAEDVMTHLDSSSREIGEVLSVIKEIADQTNLLALNASIESARAGEHGRGFAVVADEVRQLASRTRQSTDDINKMIDIIQRASEQAIVNVKHNSELSTVTMTRIRSARQQLDEANHGVEEIYNLSTQIATAVEEQSQVMSEMDTNIHTIASLAESTHQGSDNIKTISQNVVDQIHDMHKTLTTFRTSH